MWPLAARMLHRATRPSLHRGKCNPTFAPLQVAEPAAAVFARNSILATRLALYQKVATDELAFHRCFVDPNFYHLCHSSSSMIEVVANHFCFDCLASKPLHWECY